MKQVFNRGFTLIELLVVVGVFGIILVSISTILINTIKARNRTYIIQDLETNGNSILDKMKYNLINAIPETIVCDGDTISFINKVGVGDSTVIACEENVRIASSSAQNTSNVYVLSSDKVHVTGCGNFVTCNSSALGEVQSVDVSFRLRAGSVLDPAVEASVARDFKTKVTVRR